jgi:hypothetical protein
LLLPLYTRHVTRQPAGRDGHRGRVYLSKDLRDRYGERFHVVTYRDHIEFVPIDEDPLEGLREAVGDAFDGESVEDLREKGRQAASEEARSDVRRD